MSASTVTPAAFAPLTPLATLAAALAAGSTSSRELVETALARIDEPAGQGATVFLSVDAAAARRAADAADAMRRAGMVPSPLLGIPISIKDLFDVAGQPTAAGSRVLANAAPAARDATVIARLKRAGAVPLGRTNMSEFAFTGLGLNPHYGTPLAPWQRAERHVAGGSSSGAAASVADGMAAAALGTDTGGSVRLPAAFCGLTGFKPSAHRVPVDGVLPLSPTLDSVGPIGVSVGCCAVLDRVLADTSAPLPSARPLAGARIGVLANYVCEDLDTAVAGAFDRALKALSAAGAHVVDVRLEELQRLPQINRIGCAAIDAYAWHRSLLATHGDAYDPRVRARILKAEGASAADYIELLAARRALIADVAPTLAAFDALVCPTVAIVPPQVDALAVDDEFNRVNGLVLRNTSIVNFLDGCALSLPCHRPGDAPVGLMLFSGRDHDDALLGLGMSVEAALAAAA